MIHLGYEIGTGEPIAIPLKHLAVVGQTQESGKTTTLEALVSRAGVPALAFVTKRGESSFAGGRRLQPYFRDRADWQFVDQLLEAQLREKNKFLRPWIIRICRNTQTLADVHAAIKKGLTKAKGLSEGVYTQLDAYLDLIVPEISRAPLARTLALQPGLNVMDVSGYPAPMQMLFVQSAIDHINAHERGHVTIIPEAWEFIPEAKGSPVKASAVAMVRKGAALGNFIWVDSQDTAGVDKTILRGCSVWLIGVQREANEIKRNLTNIPAGIRKPKPGDVAHLQRGQFFACWSDRTVKVYVQPTWLPDLAARHIARGGIPPHSVMSAIERYKAATIATAELDAVKALAADAAGSTAARSTGPASTTQPEDEMNEAIANALDRIDTKLDRMLGRSGPADPQAPATTPSSAPADEEGLYQRFKARLLEEAPALVKVLAQRPEINVEIERNVITADGTSTYGMLAQLIAEGFFDSTVSATAAFKEIQRRGFKGISARVYEQLPALTSQGFLTKEGKDGYRSVKGMKVNIEAKKKGTP